MANLSASARHYRIQKTLVPMLQKVAGFRANLSILFCFCTAFLVTTDAQQIRYLGDLAFYKHGSHIEIVNNSSFTALGDLVIPNSIEGLPVTRIGKAAFKDKKIRSVVLPDTVLVIGEDAFYRCKDLQTVQFSENLKEIGDQAFFDCEGLEQLTLPLGLRTIGSGAFRHCHNLSSISLPDGLVSMGDYVFERTSIRELALPASIDVIPAYAYSGTDLTEIIIPDHVVEIGERAFSSCRNVRSIDFGTSLKRIGEYAFSACNSLSAVMIPETVNHLGSGAFNGCERLAGVIMEGPVPSYVGASLFSRYNGLPNLYYDVAHSGLFAYANMPWQAYNSTPIQDWRIVDGFVCVVLEKEVYLVAYTGTSPTLTIPETLFDLPVTKIGTYAFFRNERISSVRIPRTVKLIEPYAFSECVNLTSVFIEGADVAIDERAFYRSFNLTACVFEDDAPVLLGNNNFEARTTLYFYEDARNFTEPRHVYYDSQRITSAGNYNGIFYVNEGEGIEVTGCSGDIEALVVPDYIENLPVRSIARGAFAENDTLRSVQLPETMREIGVMAFRYCDSLESINLPEGIQVIPEEAFIQCLALENINFPSTLVEIGKRAFYRCPKLRNLELSEGFTTIGIMAFDGCPIETIIFPESFESLGGTAFSGCSSLRWVQFLGDVEYVGSRAFNNCSSLRWVEFGGSLTELEVDAFNSCTSLSAIVYFGALAPSPQGFNSFYNTPDGITIYHLVGVSGFDHSKYNPCAKVVIEDVGQEEGFFYINLGEEIMIAAADDSYESVVVPEQLSSLPVTEIGPGAFIATSHLLHIHLPDSLVKIGADAFYNSSIRTIDFGQGVKLIGDRAFSSAHGLAFVELPASVESIGLESFRGCANLETLILGENLAAVGDKAFDYSSDLNAVVFLGDAPTLGVDSLGGYSNTKYYHMPSAQGFDATPWTSLSLQSFTEYGFLDGLHYVGDGNGVSIVGFSNQWTDGALIIPAQINGIPVTTLGARLFYYKHLTSVTIPSSIHTIESQAFNTVYGLKRVIVDGVLPDDFLNRGIPSTLGTLNFQIYETNVPDDYVSPFSNLKPKRYTGYDSGSDLYYFNTGQEIHIVGTAGSTAEIVIPSYIEGLPVARVLDRAFHSELELVSVQLPVTLESIGEDAFYKCENLGGIIIPESVLTIGPGAFERCASLVHVQLPSGLEILSDTTFYLCTSLRDITLPDGLLTIGNHALRACSSLSSVNIPASVTAIASSAFRDCVSLTRIVIPEGIEQLEAYTFQGCIKLESVQLPSTLNFLGVSAFYQCSELRHVVIPALVAEVGNWAFKNCHSLNTIVFEGNAPAQIGSDCFLDVGRYFSFYHLSSASGFSLTTWQGLPVQAIQGYGFVQDMLIINDGTGILIRDYSGVDEVLALPSHFNGQPVTQIDPAAFIGRQSLASLTIPDSVAKIGEYAFAGCDQLQSLVLPDGLTVIAEGTFSACSALESMALPASVTSIGASAFSGCRRLNIHSLPDGIYSIGDYAFADCDSIVTMDLPDSVTACGVGVFQGCKGLVEITIPVGISTVPEAMFQNCSALGAIQFHVGVTGIEDYAFANCIALQELSFPDSLTSIGAFAFQDCVGLSSLVFPEALTTLGNYAFEGCVGLSSIYFTGDAPRNYGSQVFPSHSEAPMVFFDAASTGFTVPTWNGMPVGGASGVLGGIYYRVVDSTVEITGVADETNVIEIPSFINGMPVTSIGSRAFFRNTELLSIVLPNTIEYIGERAFSECERLSGLVLPESLKAIGEHAFSQCSRLVEVRIPQNVESVGDWAFFRCGSLRSVRIAASGVAFGNNVFYNCYSLVSIHFEAEGPSSWEPSYANQNCRIWVLENTELSNNLGVFGNISKRVISGYDEGIFYRISDGTHVPEGDIEIAGFSGYTGWFVIPSEIDGRKVSGIANNAFSGNEDLRYVFIPEGLLRIGSYAFSQCSQLAFIDIPDSVTEIGTQAFNGCIGLRSVTIGRGIDRIGDNAFTSTTKLMEILFTGDAPENASYTFFEDSRMVKHYFGAEGFEGSSWLRYRTRPVSHDQSSWREFYGLAQEIDLWGAEDNAGSPLVLRYAFNLAPGAVGEAYSLTPPVNGEDLEVSFYSMAKDVIYIVETSTDLIEWSTDAVTVTEDLENGRTIAKVPYVEGSNFIRIRVEQNPDF